MRPCCDEVCRPVRCTNPDTDGDGFTDLDELAAGTNPNDALSFPATDASSLDAMFVDVRAQLREVGGPVTGNAVASTVVKTSPSPRPAITARL